MVLGYGFSGNAVQCAQCAFLATGLAAATARASNTGPAARLNILPAGDTTGFPDWIQTQRENEASWQGYRKGCLTLMEKAQNNPRGDVAR
jgi:hypothetical protein